MNRIESNQSNQIKTHPGVQDGIYGTGNHTSRDITVKQWDTESDATHTSRDPEGEKRSSVGLEAKKSKEQLTDRPTDRPTDQAVEPPFRA